MDDKELEIRLRKIETALQYLEVCLKQQGKRIHRVWQQVEEGDDVNGP